MTQIHDTLIIGAGIAGASLGYRLAGQQRVLMLEREAQPGYHATGRSAAMFMEAYGTPQIQALTRASRAFYERPPTGFCEHGLLEPRGCLYVASHEQRDLLDATYAQNQANGTAVSLLDADAAVALVPSLRGELLAGAVHETGAMDLDVHALHQGFLRGFRQAGGELRCNAELVRAQYVSGLWQVELGDGSQLQARQLVNAAGAWADRVAGLCGVDTIGLQPCRRSAFTFPGPAQHDFARWPAVIGVDESFYFKPDAGQLLGSPANADPVEPQDAAPEELDLALGIFNIEAITTLEIPSAQPQLGRLALVRRRRRPGDRLRSAATGVLLAGRPGWLRYPVRRRGLAAGGGPVARPALVLKPHPARGRACAPVPGTF